MRCFGVTEVQIKLYLSIGAEERSVHAHTLYTSSCAGWEQRLLIYYARAAAAKLISLIVCSAKQSNCRRSPQRLSTTARRFLCFCSLSACAVGVCALKTQAAKQCRWPLGIIACSAAHAQHTEKGSNTMRSEPSFQTFYLSVGN